MGFRRYGGDIETGNIGGGVRFTGFAFTVATIGGLIAYHNASFSILFITLAISLPILLLGSYFTRTARNERKEERILKHIAQAEEHYKNREYEKAKESIRRIKMYSELPSNIKLIEAAVSQNLKGS